MERRGGRIARLLLGTVILGSFGPSAALDTQDIYVRAFRDPNCFERFGEMTLIDGGCYANVYSNLTAAFQGNIITYSYPQEFTLTEYIDDCNNMYNQPRRIRAGLCVRFVGQLYGIMSMVYRSPTCSNFCSTINVAVQTFWSMAQCKGTVYQVNTFPLQSECLRVNNGTQLFSISNGYTNITQVTFPGDRQCTSGAVTKSYSMTNGYCYPLYTDKQPMSFTWSVALSSPSAISSSPTVPRLLSLAAPATVAAAHLLPGRLRL